MIHVNQNYTKLASSYLFVEIAKRVAAFQEKNGSASVIKLGIGDVTRPLPQSVIEAFHQGVDEQADPSSFRGYGPERGYSFLREAIATTDYAARGCTISPEEIFVSDGAKCDTANFQELFAADTRVAVPDPVYPVYVDTNVMAGRTGAFVDGRYEGLLYLESVKENGFVPAPPEEAVDLIYLCFPNNPTGATATREQLAEWVDYAQRNGSLILFDAAYESFIRDDTPHSIYEIKGAESVAVEFRSLSKTAGFTGTRLAYTVVPKTIKLSPNISLWDLWNRRQSTKFNGVSYPVQRAATAVFSEAGQKEVRELGDYYLENASRIARTMRDLGYTCVGGENSPYVWVEVDGASWEFFDRMLTRCGVVITPGAGFGTMGEGYIRISAFNDADKVDEALDKIRTNL